MARTTLAALPPSSAADRNRVFHGKMPMCGRRGAFFKKSLKIMIMGLKPAENGAPKDWFPWLGCGKFERRAWQRASYRQTEIAYASPAGCHTNAFIGVLAYTILPSPRPPSTMKVMKSQECRPSPIQSSTERLPKADTSRSLRHSQGATPKGRL